MKVEVFAVLDKAVGAFMPPFFARSRGEAMRSFMVACSDEKGKFVQFPEDYVLYALGSFEDTNGMLEKVEPDRLMSALEAVQASRRE